MTQSKSRPFSKFSEFQTEQALAHELPYWDIFEDDVSLADGTLAAVPSNFVVLP